MLNAFASLIRERKQSAKCHFDKTPDSNITLIIVTLHKKQYENVLQAQNTDQVSLWFNTHLFN